MLCDYVFPNFFSLLENTERECKRRHIGVTVLTLTTELITELQLRGTELPPNVKHGVLVWKVVLGSPAHW